MYRRTDVLENKTNSHFKLFVWALLILLPFGFLGCVSSGLSESHGQSFEAMLSAQTVNPDGPEDKTPVDECPGSVAGAIYESYLKGLGGASLAEMLGTMMLGSQE